MAEVDKLVEINRVDLSQLRDLYLVNWPVNLLGYYTVDNFIRWIEKDLTIKNLIFYSLNGDWSDGTFVAIDRYQLFLNSLSDSNDKLGRLLHMLDWSRGFKVSTFRQKHRSAVLDTVNAKNLSREFDSETLLYYMPKEKAIEMTVNVPNGMKLGALEPSHAVLADSVWPNRHIGSTFFLKRVAKWNSNIGLFSQEGKLVGWCFRFQTGVLGALQVDSQHVGKGYGSIVCRAITKRLGDMGHDAFTCVGQDNAPSNRVFLSAGYKVIDKTYWLRTRPTIPFEWTDVENE